MTKTGNLLAFSAAFALAGCSTSSLQDEKDAPVGDATEAWERPNRDPSRDPEALRPIAPDELARIDKYLSERYPASAVRATVQAPGEPAFDCVDKHQQPGLAPGEQLAEPPPLAEDEQPAAADRLPRSTGCPKGTVKIQRIERDDLLRLGSVRNFTRKFPLAPGAPAPQMACDGVPPTTGHDHVVVAAPVTGTGLSSNFTVWKPAVARGDFSLSQIWGSRGQYEDCTMQTVEAGWIVNESINRDLNPHLFVYWTADAYRTTGCYNLTCGAFRAVETDHNYVGMPFTPSVIDGVQSRIQLRWQLISGKWWLTVTTYRSDGTIKAAERIGYYSANLFPTPGLRDGLAFAEYGGEVATNQPPSPKRTTDMGSGRSPIPFNGDTLDRVASHTLMTYTTATNGVYSAVNLPRAAETIISSPNCYNGYFANDPDDEGIFLYFGGTGNDGVNCR